MSFDPQAFLDMPVDQPFEKRPPLPVRDYTALLKTVTPRQWQSQSKFNDDGTAKRGMALDVELDLQLPPDVQTTLGLKQPNFTLRDSIMLDLNEQGGFDLSPGRNRQLREYREALDMNKPGQVFRPRDMAGRTLTVRLKHEEWQGAVQERVGGVARG